MKIMHKPTLRRERAIRYTYSGEMQMINNYDKVQSEIEIWTQLNHPYIAKLFEMIDDENHDYLYLVIEFANMGQIANWNFKAERYERSEPIYNFVKEHLKVHDGFKDNVPEVEQVAQYIFRQLVSAVLHLHTRANVIHRDIKPENVLFCGDSA
jgi:serine/threonine protein kinase